MFRLYVLVVLVFLFAKYRYFRFVFVYGSFGGFVVRLGFGLGTVFLRFIILVVFFVDLFFDRNGLRFGGLSRVGYRFF